MNKKIAIISILVVFVLVGISTVSALNARTSYEKKASPLFGIRTIRATTKAKIQEITNRIFIGYAGPLALCNHILFDSNYMNLKFPTGASPMTHCPSFNCFCSN